ATADSHKKLSLELGGKSPFVVFEDADLDSAVEGLVDGIWLNQGQVCCAGSRLLMQESIAVPLTKKLQVRMAALRVGAPLDKTTDIGAIVARVQLERIEGLVAQGVAEGASCWQPDVPLPARGLFYRPTLLTNVHPTSVVARTEIFGPVLAAMTFRTPAEAVELANNTAYGHAARVIDWTVKLYIGGKQVRPDSGYSLECRSSTGALLGETPLGNRKDIRNAVEAARRAQQWGSATTHQRAQVLYYAAENLTQR